MVCLVSLGISVEQIDLLIRHIQEGALLACMSILVDIILIGKVSFRRKHSTPPLPACHIRGDIVIEKVRIHPASSSEPTTPVDIGAQTREIHTQMVVYVSGSIESLYGGIECLYLCPCFDHLDTQML